MESLVPDLVALGTVILIDIVLAADNALVVGMVAAGVAAEQRRRAIALGIVIALGCRIAFSLVAMQLLQIIGLLLAGGLLLLWVTWKLWRDIRVARAADAPHGASSAPAAQRAPTSYASAVWQITAADVSMSLDNVIAVAGAARDNMVILIFGLVLSIGLMGMVSVAVAQMLQRHRWIAYLGVLVIAYVASAMIYDGGKEVIAALDEG